MIYLVGVLLFASLKTSVGCPTMLIDDAVISSRPSLYLLKERKIDLTSICKDVVNYTDWIQLTKVIPCSTSLSVTFRVDTKIKTVGKLYNASS